jgi:hypothetical protein
MRRRIRCRKALVEIRRLRKVERPSTSFSRTLVSAASTAMAVTAAAASQTSCASTVPAAIRSHRLLRTQRQRQSGGVDCERQRENGGDPPFP